MCNRRDQILKELTPKVARLTLVSDPDGLLLEEGVLVPVVRPDLSDLHICLDMRL